MKSLMSIITVALFIVQANLIAQSDIVDVAV